MYKRFGALVPELEKEANIETARKMITKENIHTVFNIFDIKIDTKLMKESCNFLASLLHIESAYTESLIFGEFKAKLSKLVPHILLTIEKDIKEMKSLKA